MKAIGFPRVSIGKSSSEHIYRIPAGHRILSNSKIDVWTIVANKFSFEKCVFIYSYMQACSHHGFHDIPLAIDPLLVQLFL